MVSQFPGENFATLGVRPVPEGGPRPAQRPGRRCASRGVQRHGQLARVRSASDSATWSTAWWMARGASTFSSGAFPSRPWKAGAANSPGRRLHAVGQSVAKCLAVPAAALVKPTQLHLLFEVGPDGVIPKCHVDPVDKYSFSAGCWWASLGPAYPRGAEDAGRREKCKR